MINGVDLGKVIGGTKVLAEKLSDTEGLRKLLVEGFPYAFESTLKQEGKFQALESDRVFRFLQVAAHAIESIGDDDKAGRWLTKPNRALQGKVPLDLLDTPIGASEVDEFWAGLSTACTADARLETKSQGVFRL